MGYETTFTLKKELDSEFKPSFNYKEGEKEKERSVLIATCMLRGFEEADGYFGLRKSYDNISMAIRSYAVTIENEWKNNLSERINEKNEINFCGWEYSKDDSAFGDEEDSYLDYVIDELFSLAIIKVDGPWDKDTAYHAKRQDIIEVVDGIEDLVWSHMDWKFIKRYRNSDDATEYDGYDRLGEKLNVKKDDKDISNE